MLTHLSRSLSSTVYNIRGSDNGATRFDGTRERGHYRKIDQRGEGGKGELQTKVVSSVFLGQFWIKSNKVRRRI